MAKIVLKLKKQLESSQIESESKNKQLSCSIIVKHFYEPILQTIENDGYNEEGILIADVDGLRVMAEILDSIINEKTNENGEILGAIQIIENAVIQQDLEQQEDEEIQIIDETDDEDDKEDDEENLDEEDEDEEDKFEQDSEDEDIEECLDEFKECDSYLGNMSEDSMDDY